MERDYFDKRAELHRKTSKGDLPDAPMMKHLGKVSEGTLREVLDAWGALSSADRLHHVILMGGGALSDTSAAALLAQARTLDA